MSGGTEPKKDEAGAANLPSSIIGKSPEQIESLLRFLVTLVLHKEEMSPEEYENKTEKLGQTRTERTKKSLLELLKSDESLRQSLFPGSAVRQEDKN